MLLAFFAAACCIPLGTDDVPTSEDVVTSPVTTLAVAAMDAMPDFAPVKQGELAPPEGAQGPGLKVLMVGPQGPQNKPLQATVVFDRPMVELADIDSMSGKVPLTCLPHVPGQARWAGTSTAVYVPDGYRFPNATGFTCSVPKDTAAVDGTKLAGDVSFRFETARPRLSRSKPYDGDRSADPRRPILLQFNQPVDPEAVLAKVTLKDDAGARLPLSASRPPSDDPEAPDFVVADKTEQSVLLTAQLGRDMGYTLTIAEGLAGTEGPLGMSEDRVLSFRTIPPAAILDVEPTGDAVDPYAWISLDLATNTSGENLNPKIHISPEPPDGWHPAEGYAWSRWSHSLRLAPLTTYTITVDPGATDEYGQTYREGRSWSFTTGHLAPLIDMADRAMVYPANNPTRLPLRSRNLRELFVAVKAVDSAWVVDHMRDWHTWSSDGRQLSGHRAIYTRDGGLDDAIRVDEVDLAPQLVDGKGLVVVEAWSPEVVDYRGNPRVERALLQVTDLGTTLKLGPDGATVWVTSLATGEPVEGADVSLVLDGKTVWSGSTDGDGVATCPALPFPEDYSRYRSPVWAVVGNGSDRAVVVSNDPHELSTWQQGVWASSVDEGSETRIHAYADRGVYKPGDTAHLAFTARTADAEGLAIEPSPYGWTCSDARGSEIAEGEGKLDGHGAGSFDLDIPADGPYGYASCRIVVDEEGDKGTAHVELPVQAYREPSFRVDVSAPEHGLAGTVVQTSGQGRYLFGAPMAGAKASWSVRASITTPSPEGWDEFSFQPATGRAWWDHDNGFSETAITGEGELSREGSVPIVFTPPITEQPLTRSYTVELTVVDVDRQRISNRTELLVHPADLYVGLRPKTGLGEAGKAVEFDLVGVDPSGEVVKGVPVELTISRRTWDTVRKKGIDGRWTWESTPTDEVVHSETVSTRKDPVGSSFTPEQGGFYVIKATARDARGRATATEDGLYVAGAGAAWARSDDNLVELLPDKDDYAPTDTAKVLIKAPKKGLHALVTAEREGVLWRKVVKLSGTADTVKVPLTEAMVPNVYVSVVLVDSAPPATGPDGGVPSYFLGYAELSVSPEGRRLDVGIDTDKPSYQPGEEVTVTVDVHRSDAGVPGAHVVLYAVDYGVLSLTGYTTPDPFERHYADHELHVVTSDTRTRVVDRAHFLAKGAADGGGGGIGKELRDNFQTTPLWEPNLQTDGSGKLVHTFKLPDNLTTFRIMAVVDAGDDAFGSGEREVAVNLPLIARPALPRHLRLGDRALAGIVVHNNRDAERSVKVEAEATGVKLDGAPVTVKVPAHGALEVPFVLTDPVPGKATFRFQVSSEGDRDAVEHIIPVTRPQPSETVATAGSTTTSASEPLGDLGEIVPGVGGLVVSVSPTVMNGTAASLEYILDYPHGCLEQTSSLLLAAVLGKELGPRIGLVVPPVTLDAWIETGKARMSRFEHSSGGYTLWPGSSYPSAMATAWAVTVQHRAGQEVKPEAVRFLREFMAGKWTPTWWDKETIQTARARVALALARIGQGDAGYNADLYKRQYSMSLTGRAELMEAIALTTGRDSRTAALLRALEGQAQVEATAARIVEPGGSAWTRLWDGDAAPSAATLQAIMAADPDNALAERLAIGLAESREQARWSNTYTTIRAFSALAAYAAVREKDLATGATGTLGGAPMFEALFEGPKVKQSAVGIDAYKPGKLQIEAQGGRVYYETRLQYARQTMPPRDEGFTLRRDFELVEGGGPGGQVTPGALVRVTLSIVTPVDRYDVAVVDPMPAGLEAVNSFFKTTAAPIEIEDTGWSTQDSGGMDELPTWTSDWVFNHRELRDDAVALYADYMPAGIHAYRYYARATTPGDYAHPAATVEQMYRPEIFGRTEAGRFVIGDAIVAGR